ncbi:MAG TPA: energy transducer TonB [Holophagaceae bacterium]|nr:energy transducer TonB [Holophagaceae bacterium]
MRRALLFPLALSLCAQEAALPPVQIVIETQIQGRAVPLDLGVLNADLETLLRENGLAPAPSGSPGAMKLTLRPESFRLPDGLCGLSAVAYLERPGQPKVLRGRVIAAFRGDIALAMELRQASLDVAASLLGRSLPDTSQFRRVAVEGRPGPERVGEVPFQSLKVRLHPFDPLYPRLALQRGVQGRVKARVTLGADGRPRRADLIAGPDELALAALYSALRWDFEPVQGPQGAMEVRTEMDIPFSLSSGTGDPSLPLADQESRHSIQFRRKDQVGE